MTCQRLLIKKRHSRAGPAPIDSNVPTTINSISTHVANPNIVKIVALEVGTSYWRRISSRYCSGKLAKCRSKSSFSFSTSGADGVREVLPEVHVEGWSTRSFSSSYWVMVRGGKVIYEYVWSISF